MCDYVQAGAPSVDSCIEGRDRLSIQEYNYSSLSSRRRVETYDESFRQGKLAHRTLIYLWLKQDLR